jgi:tetratricopeptide (TPR) repeat protein
LFVLTFFYSVSYGKDKGPDEAWQLIQSETEMLWSVDSRVEGSGGRQLWEVISALKHYIQNYPESSHIAEAYYLLGVAYSRAGYMPEAEAHWMITAKYYPETSWAGDALSMLARWLEESGDTKKLDAFYRELVKSFPRSNAALAMETVLGIEELEKGRIDLARAVVRDVEKKRKDAGVTIPRLLDLKARIAEIEGRDKDARQLWIHYLNLVKAPEIRADILYRIAETYRKAGKPLDAHKYYALIKRDFPFMKEAQFARFRMAEIEERARGRMEGYVSGMGYRNLTKIDNLYTNIIRNYPEHPITMEVMTELMQIKLDEHRNLQALKLAREFSRKYRQGSRFSKRVENMAKKAAAQLVADTDNTVSAQQAVEWCRQFIKKENNNRIEEIAARAGISIWYRLLDMLLAAGDYFTLLESFREYEGVAGSDEPEVAKGRQIALAAVSRLGEELLESGKDMQLLNYYYHNRKFIDSLKSPGFYLLVGRAWEKVGVPPAAMGFFYMEYQDRGESREGGAALMALATSAVSNHMPEQAENALLLYDRINRNAALSPAVSLVRARAAFARGKWLPAFNMAKDALSGNETATAGAEIAFKAAVLLGRWEYVRRIWDRFAERFQAGKELLRLWGDTALGLMEPEPALEAYGFLKELEPDDISTDWKIARAQEIKGDIKGAEDTGKGVAAVGKSIWSDAAGAENDYMEFVSGPAGELL